MQELQAPRPPRATKRQPPASRHLQVTKEQPQALRPLQASKKQPPSALHLQTIKKPLPHLQATMNLTLPHHYQAIKKLLPASRPRLLIK